MMAGSPIVRLLRERNEYTPVLLCVRFAWSGIFKLLKYQFTEEQERFPDYLNTMIESSFVAIDEVQRHSVTGCTVQLFMEGQREYLLVVGLQKDVPLVL